MKREISKSNRTIIDFMAVNAKSAKFISGNGFQQIFDRANVGMLMMQWRLYDCYTLYKVGNYEYHLEVKGHDETGKGLNTGVYQIMCSSPGISICDHAGCEAVCDSCNRSSKLTSELSISGCSFDLCPECLKMLSKIAAKH